MRYLFCGDRNWQSPYWIWRRIQQLPEGSVVIEGEQKGADRLSRIYAEARGLEVEKYEAQWEIGPVAGPLRNTKMLDEGKPDVVIAFHNDIAKSKGTKDCIRRALERNIPVILCDGGGNSTRIKKL